MKYRSQFAKRVRRLRRIAKLSLEKAAERGNITPNFWGDVERGKKVPSLDTIIAMAKGLDVSPKILFSLEREDEGKDLRKQIEILLDGCTPQQIELVHRVVSVLLEP